MTRKVTVSGDSNVVSGLTQHAEIVSWPSPDAGGADVVVVASAQRLEELAGFVARRCPAAVVIATDARWCEELLQRTCFPRGRVLATGDPVAAADAVLADSGAELAVVLSPDGPVRARVGAAGVLSL